LTETVPRPNDLAPQAGREGVRIGLPGREAGFVEGLDFGILHGRAGILEDGNPLNQVGGVR
jgi:hypothetical protein